MQASASNDNQTLLLPSEVAALFRVDPKTVTRWANSGRISAIRTLGGHRRFLESEIMEILDGERAMKIPVQR
ncbi:BldC family transcriptional regulator [Haloglycomyces albus]|uniref:BldC family transcriptional regulator n=1 Tax=Haloglycomyces albus TaxID=526067 RepID=UPI00046D6AFE|nr:BldC family transcriptional regulator [Haloglycomyces albus]